MIRFCSALYNRTVQDQYALAAVEDDGTRELVKIRLILKATLIVQNRPPLELMLTLVDTFLPLEHPQPWSYRNIDLGYRAYSGHATVTPPRFIQTASLQATVIISRTTCEDQPILTVVSCDREGQEPEYWLDSDGPQEDAEALQRNRYDDEEEDEGLPED